MIKDIMSDLRELLTTGTTDTQEEIGNVLAKKGYDVNQSKISRMLRKIGAVKSKNESGQIVYRLPKEPAPPTPSNLLTSLVINVFANEVMAVVTTSPGAASVISRLLDYHSEKIGILGTVAGDDTILIIPKSIKQTKLIVQKVKDILLTKD